VTCLHSRARSTCDTRAEPFVGNGYACNNRGTVGNGVFYSVRAVGVIRRTIEVRIVKLEGSRHSERTSARKLNNFHC
jgi:hypothetical protein